MAIYRGIGGSGEANTDGLQTDVTQKAADAADSASAAASSATAAEAAQTAAEAAQAAAEAAQESIDGLYLGALASDPTVDSNGDSVTQGDWYFNTTISRVKIYNGSTWDIALTTLVSDTSPQLGGDLDTNGNNINFGDNDKVQFGASDDLEIYHNGTNNYIDGDADLYIRPKHLQNGIIVEQDGAVILYHDNALKLQTNSTGVDIFTTLDVNTITNTGGTLNITTDASVTGNISVTGTVDGRDIATDGTKLDGIEAGATADQTKADIDALNIDADTLDGQHGTYYTGYTDTAIANLVDTAPATLDTLNELAAALGDDANFSTTVTNSIATKVAKSGDTMTGNLTLNGGNIVMTGSETVDGRDVSVDGAKLDGIEAGADVTDATNVEAAGALMDSEVTNLAQVKAFDSADYATAAQGTTADSAMQDLVDDTTPQLGGDLDSNGNNVTFGDTDKAIFGADNDLEISTGSYLSSTWGELHFDNQGYITCDGGSFTIKNGAGVIGSELMASFVPNGAAYLYYDNNSKFETSDTGVTVTGTAATDGVTVDGVDTRAHAMVMANLFG